MILLDLFRTWNRRPILKWKYSETYKLDSYGKTVELGFLSEAHFLQNMRTMQLFKIQAKA